MKKFLVATIALAAAGGAGYYYYYYYRPKHKGGGGGDTGFNQFNDVTLADSTPGYIPKAGSFKSCVDVCSSDSSCTAYTVDSNGGYCKIWTAPANTLAASSVTKQGLTSYVKDKTVTAWGTWNQCPTCVPPDQQNTTITTTRQCIGGGVCLGPDTMSCGSNIPTCSRYSEDANVLPYFSSVDPNLPFFPGDVGKLGPTQLIGVLSSTDLKACEDSCSSVGDKCTGVWFEQTASSFTPKVKGVNCALLGTNPDGYGRVYIPHSITSLDDVHGNTIALKQPMTSTSTWREWSMPNLCAQGNKEVTATRTCNSASEDCIGPSSLIVEPNMYYAVDELADTNPPPDVSGLTYMSQIQQHYPSMYTNITSPGITTEGDCAQAAYRYRNMSPGDKLPSCGGYTWDTHDPAMPCKLYSLTDVINSSSARCPSAPASLNLKVARCKDDSPNIWSNWGPYDAASKRVERYAASGDFIAQLASATTAFNC